MKLNWAIACLLFTGGVLLVVLVVAGGLWGILTAVGDAAGAAGVRAVALVAGVCLCLNVLGLVALMGVAQISGPRERFPDEE